ncbi:CPBP family intramembrane glutamic endopeptidase [Bacillus sp. AK128]
MKKTVGMLIIKLLILSIYFSLLPFMFQMSDVMRFIHIVLFFPLAFLVSKLDGSEGMKSYGITFHSAWIKRLLYGLLLGSFAWWVLFAFYLYFGKLQFQGIKEFSYSLPTFLIILFGFGTGSLINDMITRGLVFYHLKNRISPVLLFVISISIYTFDDGWYAGFSLQNTLFSVSLGLSLTYVFYKTNSIWATTGIHFGLNLVYGLFFGITGVAGDGVFVVSEGTNTPNWTDWLSIFVAAGIFYCVLFYFRRKKILTDTVQIQIQK